jgi:hypothetical protein
MATTRPTLTSLVKQAERLCLEARVCPRHPRENLWCATCQLGWDGTPEEFDELIALAERLPYDRSPGPTLHRCEICRDALWCDACYREALSRQPPKEVTMPLSDEEIARYQKLSAYLTLRDRSDGLPPIRLQWGDPEPAEASESEPTADITFESNSDAPPVPGSEPATESILDQIKVDDDAEVDAELADLLAQLQRKLQR